MIFVFVGVIYTLKYKKKIKFCMVILPCAWILAHGEVTIWTCPVQYFAVC